MIASIVVGLTGMLIFLFVFWKRLKEDYSSEIIFKSGASVLLGILIGWAVSSKLYPPAFLWFEFLGALGGLGFAAYFYRVRFYETLEAFVISVLPMVSLLFLKDSVISSSLNSFIAFLTVLIFIFAFYYLDIHYKNFTWYKSGKIGFTGLATLILIFVVRSGLALWRITMISFLSGYEIYLSLVGAVVSLILLINLGRQKK